LRFFRRQEAQFSTVGIILFSQVIPKIDQNRQQRYENHQDCICQGETIRVSFQMVIDDQIRDCHNNRDDDKHSLCNWVHFFRLFTLERDIDTGERFMGGSLISMF